MSSSNRRSPEESRWLKVLSTLNEFQARLFVADKALDPGEVELVACRDRKSVV